MCRWVAYFSPQPILLGDVVSTIQYPLEWTFSRSPKFGVLPQIERPKHSIIKQSEGSLSCSSTPFALTPHP